MEGRKEKKLRKETVKDSTHTILQIYPMYKFRIDFPKLASVPWENFQAGRILWNSILWSSRIPYAWVGMDFHRSVWNMEFNINL